MEEAVLPPSPHEYRTRHASIGRLEVLRIPHMYNLMTAGAEGTSVNTVHSVFGQDL
jgi:hypothetical protein